MKKILIILFVLLATHLTILITDAGFFLEIENKPLKDCRKLSHIHGPEDIARVEHHMFISSTYLPYRHNFEIGDIFYLDLSQEDSTPVSIAKKYNLSPHGIHVRKLRDKIRLWVVNHKKEIDSIEVFDFENGALSLVNSIESEFYINSNDIVSIDDEKFYLTHDHGSLNSFLRAIENFSRLGRGYVTFYDGKKVKKVLSNLSFPNGIVTIDDKIYIAQMLSKKVSIFRVQKDFSLTKQEEIALPYAPDNISVKDQDNLLIATHPQLFKLKAHAKIENELSPSSILNLNITSQKLKEVYTNTGEELSGSSVAVASEKDIFIGNIYGDYILKCSLK